MLGRVLDEAAAQEQRQGADGSESESLLKQQQRPPSFGLDSGTAGVGNESDTNAHNTNNNGGHQPKSRRTSHSSSNTTTTTYGALGPRQHHHHHQDPLAAPDNFDDPEYDPEEDNETYAEEDSDEEEEELQSNKCGVFSQCWKCLRFMADVEDLWDMPSPGQNSAADRTSSTSPRRKHWIVAFWFLVLATSYALERSTFKFLVDESGPFRLFSVEMVTATHATLLSLGMLVAYLIHRKQRAASGNTTGYHDPTQSTIDLPLGLPIVDVGLMALLDVVSLMLVFLTGFYVSPALTVILVQFTLPLTGFFMQFVHPQGRFACCRPEKGDDDSITDNNNITSGPPPAPPITSPADSTDRGDASDYHTPSPGNHRRAFSRTSSGRSSVQGTPISGCAGLAAEHLWGSALIVLACLLALLPAIYTIIDPDYFLYADPIPLRVAYNTLFYISSCIPAAASQLYKEHVFLHYKQPVNVHKLNLLLSVFEFLFASFLSPLVFTLQGVGSENAVWYTLYPSSNFSENFWDGLLCFFGTLDKEDQVGKYPEKAECDYVLALAVGHALSIILVGLAVDKIVSAGASKVTHRGISAGVILGVVCMAIYDFHIPEFSYGPVVDALNLGCLIFLILGSEIYHRVSLEINFETVYQTMESIYGDD